MRSTSAPITDIPREKAAAHEKVSIHGPVRPVVPVQVYLHRVYCTGIKDTDGCGKHLSQLKVRPLTVATDIYANAAAILTIPVALLTKRSMEKVNGRSG